MALFVYMYSKSEDGQYCQIHTESSLKSEDGQYCRIHTESSLKRYHCVRYLLPILSCQLEGQGNAQ